MTEANGRQVKSVELLTLERPRAIHYRWVEGPLPEVRETIRFSPASGDKTRLTYTGTFAVGRGALGWLIGLFRVRPLFNRLVREHLEQAKEIATKRAQRSHVHSRSGRAQREESQ